MGFVKKPQRKDIYIHAIKHLYIFVFIFLLFLVSCYFRMETKVPIRYLPKNLSRKDRKTQVNMLKRSRNLYKKHKYYTRKAVPSFHSKPSGNIKNAIELYGVENISPTPQLAKATGCSLKSLKKIVSKGEGAYFSSGSRPNQTAQSWGLARLASSITGGKAATVDYHILEEGCDPKKPALKLANRSKKMYKNGHSKTRRTAL